MKVEILVFLVGMAHLISAQMLLVPLSEPLEAAESKAEQASIPQMPQEEDLTSPQPTGGIKPAPAGPTIQAGAAVTLPFVFESSSPIKPIVVEVKPDDKKDQADVPPRQTKPWLGDLILSEDQPAVENAGFLSSKNLAAMTLPFVFQPSTKPWFVDDQPAVPLDAVVAIQTRPILSQNGAAVTIPGGLGGLRGAPQFIAPEEDLTSPLPSNSPASPPVAVAVPLPYVLSKPRPQQKPWFVAATEDDATSQPIGITRPIFPDGAPVAVVRPANKFVGVSTLPFYFNKAEQSGSDTIPVRQTRPFIASEQGVFVPVRQTKPFLQTSSGQQPVMTLPFYFNGNRETVPVRQTKPWLVDPSSVANFNNQGSAQPKVPVMIGSLCFNVRNNRPHSPLSIARIYKLFWSRRILNALYCCLKLLQWVKLPVYYEWAPLRYFPITGSLKNLNRKVIYVTPHFARGSAGQHVSPNRKNSTTLSDSVSDAPRDDGFFSQQISNAASAAHGEQQVVPENPVETNDKQYESMIQTTEPYAEVHQVESGGSVATSTQFPRPPVDASANGTAVETFNLEGEVHLEDVEQIDADLIVIEKPVKQPEKTITKTSTTTIVTATETQTSYCFTVSLNDVSKSLEPCPLRRKRQDYEMDDSMTISINNQFIQPSEIARFLVTQLPVDNNGEGSGASADEGLVFGSLNNSEMIEIEELGSPVMERLLLPPVKGSGNSEPLNKRVVTATTTVTMPTVAVITQTQTIKLLGGANCVPQCLFSLPKCRATL